MLLNLGLEAVESALAAWSLSRLVFRLCKMASKTCFEKGDDDKFWVWFAFTTQITRWFGERSVNILCMWRSAMPTSVFVFDVGMDGLLNRPTGHMPRGPRGGLSPGPLFDLNLMWLLTFLVGKSHTFLIYTCSLSCNVECLPNTYNPIFEVFLFLHYDCTGTVTFYLNAVRLVNQFKSEQWNCTTLRKQNFYFCVSLNVLFLHLM